MSTSPRVLRAGIVLIDPETSAVQKVIALQYNPDTLSRTLQAQGIGDSPDRSEALRLKGPPIETIRVETEIDLTDQLTPAGDAGSSGQYGLHPQLAALETVLYPASAHLISNSVLAQTGTLEIAPMESALTLFVWSNSRIIPVRLTEFAVTEEAFDSNLNPIRAKVTLGMRVLSVSDLGFQHKGGRLFMAYQQTKERLAAMDRSSVFSTLGIAGVP